MQVRNYKSEIAQNRDLHTRAGRPHIDVTKDNVDWYQVNRAGEHALARDQNLP